MLERLPAFSRRLLAITDRLRLERVLNVMVRAPRADRFQTKLVFATGGELVNDGSSAQPSRE